MCTLVPLVSPVDIYGHPNAPCFSPCTLVPPLFPHIHGYPKTPHLPIPMGTLFLPTSLHGHPGTPTLSLCWLPPQIPQCLLLPGVTPKSSHLPPQALPRALINIRTAVQTVLAGTEVELECLGLGEPQPHVTWSKVGGRIRPGVLVRAGTLTIERVERADAGQYRCTATNSVGTVQSHVILHVQGECRWGHGVGRVSPTPT